MSFFEQQYHARRATRLLVFYFFLAVVGIILSTYGLIYLLFASARNSSVATGAALDFRSPEMFFLVTAVVTIIVSLGSLYKILQLRSGGVTVAQNLGARPVHPDTEDYYERRFLNIVEEMSVASGVPVPSVFVMEESGINAFAAGYAPDTAVVTVSRGALQMLTRSELQGVVAHEFSHILNGDMKLNIRLIGLVHGILVIALIGYQLMRVLGNSRSSRRSYSRSSGKDDGGAAGIFLLGLGLLAIGYIGVFFTRLIKAAVSRQREFLADASAVQFTRNPDGIGGALKKIGGFAEGSLIRDSHAEEIAHMFFSTPVNNFLARVSSLFATHPPLPLRIERIDPSFDGSFPTVTLESVEQEVAQGDTTRQVSLSESQEGIPSPLAVAESALPNHLEKAIGLLGALPLSIRQETRNSYGARAVVFALIVLHQRTVSQEQQLDALQGFVDGETVEFTRKLLPKMSGIPPEARLSLVHLTVPALSSLTGEQRTDFLNALESLSMLDKERSLFETLLLIHVSGLLERRDPSQPEEAITAGRLRDSAQACLDLVWTISYFGHSTEQGREAAFRASLPELELSQQLSGVPNSPPQLGSLAQGFRTLRSAPLQIKERLCRALEKAAATDGMLSLDEREILRTAYAELGIPAPPEL